MDRTILDLICCFLAITKEHLLAGHGPEMSGPFFLSLASLDLLCTSSCLQNMNLTRYVDFDASKDTTIGIKLGL